MLTRSKCASKFSISGMFQYYWIYFLVTFYFQDKKYQLEDHIKHFFFLCFQTLMTYPFILSIYQTDLMPILFPFFHFPLPTFTTLLQHSFSLRQDYMYQCKSFLHVLTCVRGQSTSEPQYSFRISILGDDVQTGVPKLPIMTGRLWFLLSPLNKLLPEFK